MLRLCSYGVNYYRFDEDLLVAGLLVRDAPGDTPARRKLIQRLGVGPTVDQVEAARREYERQDSSTEREVRARKDEIIKEYVASAGYKHEVLEMLKPQFKEMLAQIHDYRQFVSQVVQNLNVILEKRSPSVDIEEKLRRASHEEVAIYWAARMMEEKLQTALFLLEPARLDDQRSHARFRLHGCVLKYVRIYQRSFEQKDIRVEVVGVSYGELIGNATAIGVIPHTFLDNALKYAPRGSNARVAFTESDTMLTLSVGSYGPRIMPDEQEQIFGLFQRGRHAIHAEPEGTGFGLYLAQLIAEKYGTTIRVEQDTKRVIGDRFWTTFSITFSRRT